MRNTILSACLSTSFLLLSACQLDTSALISSIRGTLDTTTFDSTVTSVTATNETGTKVVSPVGSDGTFQLVLPKDHEWSLSVDCEKGAVPLVFPRADGRLDATFALLTGNADIDLGKIQATQNMGQIKVNTDALTSADCVGVCVDDSATASVTCVEPPESSDGSCHGRGGRGGPHGPGGPEGRGHHGPPDFDGGLPPHLAGDGGRPPHHPRGGPHGDGGVRPSPRQHDASQPFAVPHMNPPRDVEGCDQE